MILQWFAEMFYNIIQILFRNIYIPQFPDGVWYVTDYLQMIFENGAGLVAFFLSPDLLKTCFVIVMGVVTFEEGYGMIMWILKKIPMVGIN